MAVWPRGRLYFFLLVAVISCLVLLWVKHATKYVCFPYLRSQPAVMVSDERYVLDKEGHRYPYYRGMPLVFVGGVPRSGTTLLRALLDAHPEVRCGQETRLVPRVLGLRNQWMRTSLEAARLREAGITAKILDNAVAAFILELIVRHGSPAPLLCNKDPFALRSAVYLRSLFPAARFVLLIRDGRAVVHSIVRRKVTITGLDLSDYRQCLRRWNAAIHAMFTQCRLLGPRVCLAVHYENLVLHPERTLRQVLSFLDLPWNSSVLHHEKLVGKEVSLSVLERSTDQVIKPINTDALTRWVGNLPEDVVRDMPSLAPMLATLGYDPLANPPDYGLPDANVAKNTLDLKRDKELWQNRERMVAEKRNRIWKSWLPNSSMPSLIYFNRTSNKDQTGTKTINFLNSSVKYGIIRTNISVG